MMHAFTKQKSLPRLLLLRRKCGSYFSSKTANIN
uniref:Uncharacterized protein n=1 Tax=Rhizophora mucronata TaxID=61149 RepID=A0A2P2PQ88_RHIMU